jgi:hypothetical protein
MDTVSAKFSFLFVLFLSVGINVLFNDHVYSCIVTGSTDAVFSAPSVFSKLRGPLTRGHHEAIMTSYFRPFRLN